MSNALAIANVTATLRSMIDKVAGDTVPSGRATYLRPDSKDLPLPCVNIFLYQATPSPAWRNSDLPTRRPDGSLLARPRAALDLHYLLTFHGDDAVLVPQLLMGAVVLKLHAEPILSRDAVRTVATNEVGGGSLGKFLAGSDLADQIELVRITPMSLSLEELSKLWVTFPDVDYVLSAAYVASVVLIETQDPAPPSPLPVLKPVVMTVPFSLATIDSVTPQPVDLATVPPTVITLNGRGLDPAASVSFTTPGGTGPIPGVVQPGLGGAQLAVALPAGLRAGVNTVGVQQVVTEPGTPNLNAASNVAPFLLRPTLSSVTNGPPAGKLVATVAPKVGPGQRASLLLNSTSGPTPMAFTLAADPLLVESNTLTFPSAGIPAGTYLARVRVDEGESVLTVDKPTGTYNGPKATL